MAEKIVYYGSNVEVANPKIVQNGYYKDFGYGFYCTKMEKQEKRWVMTRNGDTIVNKYSYSPNQSLKVLNFSEMTGEWLDFVVDCRKGIEHCYDIVEGPMADDQVWNYIEQFVSGRIPRIAFWEIVKFKHLTHQILFATENALMTISFEGSVKYEE